MVVFFAAAEVGLRVFDPQRIKLAKPDPILGWARIPNSEARWTKSCFSARAEFNAEGMRDVDHRVGKPQGTYRIAILGDSFVEALEVNLEETFFRRLQALLNEQGMTVETLAFGMSGYGTDQEYLLLKRHALQYSPDLVILTFTPNDLQNNLLELEYNPAKPYFEQLAPDGLNSIPFTPMPDHSNSWKFVLFKNLHVVRFLYFTLGEIPMIRNALVDFGIYANKIEVLSGPDDLEGSNVLRAEWPEAWNRSWELTTALIRRIKWEAENHGADFILFSVTSGVQLLDDEFKALQDQHPQLQLQRDRLENRLSEFAEKEDFLYFPSLPVMRKLQEQGGVVHLPCDGHWSDEAHEQAGRLLAREIVRAGLLNK